MIAAIIFGIPPLETVNQQGARRPLSIAERQVGERGSGSTCYQRHNRAEQERRDVDADISQVDIATWPNAPVEARQDKDHRQHHSGDGNQPGIHATPSTGH
jgi:hypothetical protein